MENTKTILIELLSLLVLASVAVILYRRQPIKKRGAPPLPPGPTGYPFVGSLPEMLNKKPAFRWIHKLMQEMRTEITCIRLGGVHVIPVTSPELSREFLKKYDAIFSSRPDVLSARLTSDGYLTLALSPAGDQWRKMRRVLVSHVLSPTMHQWLHQKRREEADNLVRYVHNQCLSPGKNGLVNVRDAARHYCGNAIRKMMFGKRFFGPGMEDGGPGYEEKEHVAALFTILSHLYGFAIADYLPWLEVLDLDGHKEIITNAIKTVRKYQDLEIEKRVQMWERSGREAKDDILDVLINLKNSKGGALLSTQEIKALVIEIMIETVDNPSNTVEWAMAEMINQPKILSKARDELDRVVGKDRFVQESDLPELNYIKACLKESFRLHPFTPFNVPHLSMKNTIVGGYFIPKGSHILLSRLGLGRNPRVWDDPLEYKPDRHIIDRESNVELTEPELHMLSFSTGRRGCPGVMMGSTMMIILCETNSRLIGPHLLVRLGLI